MPACRELGEGMSKDINDQGCQSLKMLAELTTSDMTVAKCAAAGKVSNVKLSTLQSRRSEAAVELQSREHTTAAICHIADCMQP